MNCFRTCDIRGTYNDEVNEDLFFRIGQAVAMQHVAGREILVGCDARASSPSLKQAFLGGLVAGGAQALDAGRVPTPAIYFGWRSLNLRAAAMITASHNPPHYNGLKLVLTKAAATPEQIVGLREAIAAELPQQAGGSACQRSILNDYVNACLVRWRPRFEKRTSGTRLILDPGNGSWSGIVAGIFRELGFHCRAIHDEPDGSFPNRSPDCAAPDSLAKLAECVRRERASAGFAWDGDGDRVAICDEDGRVVTVDQIALLLLPRLLEGRFGETVLCDVKMSEQVRHSIEENGAIPVVERSAHCALEHTMLERQCVFGCEYSGHYFFRETGGSDDALHAALVMADLLLCDGEPLSARVRRLPSIFITPDIRIPGTEEDLARLEWEIERRFPQCPINRLDGVKVFLPEGWFLVRRSVSESKLTFRFESKTEEGLPAIIGRVLPLVVKGQMELRDRLSGWLPLDWRQAAVTQ